MEKERELYKSVDTSLKGYARRLETAESQPMFREHMAGESAIDPERLKAESHMPDTLIDLFLEMNKKLDTLVSMFGKDKLLDDFPLQLEVRRLSGSGMTFAANESFSPGTHLEAVLVLSNFPLKMAGTVGRISRVDSSDSRLHEMEFTRTRETDLESIIQFVFKEQREQIRQQKWS
jgi:hypothetical protein